MRLSTSIIYQQNLDGITNAYNKWQSTGTQLSTGERVNTPSDDPIAASQAVTLKQVEALGDQYGAARTSANASLSLESSVLDQITDVYHNIQSLVVQAGDGTLSDSDRQSLATSLESYKDQLLTLANTKDSNGNYLFAGYKTDSQPFEEDADGNVTYVGGDQAISQQVDSSRTMTVSDTGADVFDRLTAGYTPEPDGSDSVANVFDTINLALTALNTPLDDADQTTLDDYSDQIAKVSRGMSNALDNVLNVESSNGSKLNELDTLDSIGTDRSTIYQTQISDLTGVDWYQAISDYTMQQAALQASYSTFNSMQQLSLFKMNS
ncbi:flagellar hook-associated protein FlgL [Martelella alba]|uniref:Flagellar hook-filament junction protein FlgL n=1 Tax=Martelella alba TaxID=2590451 RepID=A0ABY2SS24_9HYPH|nr:flagellar hook-associated protein FlgL [Martelella alba]TKI08290.1 flagellar hook-filament junction protein FlgL [Martelella alba]